VSHLREQISAVIDGELTGAELDRANAHLAACGRCRAEAAGLRQLKRELRELAGGPFDATAWMPPDPAADAVTGRAAGAPAARGEGSGQAEEALTRRLLAMAGPGGPVPSRRFRREQFNSNRREPRGGRPGTGRGGPGGRGGARPGRYPHADMPRYAGRPPRALRRRGRYVVWSAVSLVVVGIGAAAFNMGGGNAEPGPKITPQLELQMFGLEHAINSGDVPFPDPTQAPTARP
jgi:putative zinc finger protein